MGNNVHWLTFYFFFCKFTLCLRPDPNGYAAYCPCMGRFGNQADHFLGTLAFAHGLNRTLILPPWIEYPPRSYGSIQVPFDRYFNVASLEAYHRVITMELFMKELAPTLWPAGKRTVFCYGVRHGSDNKSCNAKEGNPFGPFWDNFKIDFDHSEFYGPLQYDTSQPEILTKWNERYPASRYPILAFSGAPAAFPVRKEHVKLHQYLTWSEHIKKQCDDFISKHIGLNTPYLGIHLRNGIDWKNACEHAESSPDMFASPQCFGYHGELGKLTTDVCFPPPKDVIKDVKKWIKKKKLKVLFIATDDDPMIKEFNKALKSLKVKIIQQTENNPHLDLAILGQADHYIGNCVSTFSAFAVRERRVHNKSLSFFNFQTNTVHEEL